MTARARLRSPTPAVVVDLTTKRRWSWVLPLAYALTIVTMAGLMAVDRCSLPMGPAAVSQIGDSCAEDDRPWRFDFATGEIDPGGPRVAEVRP